MIIKPFIKYFLYLLIFILPINSFLFSVIMSIYNTGKFLDDSIGSLINQTIGFEENIQIILVNDGSIDNSKEICLKYKKQYIKNIVYIYKENGGLSSARNIGLKYVQGKYVNFLDPDDFWSKNTFRYVYEFFENYPGIDMVAGRMKFFESRNDYHSLDYKFFKTRIVDLMIDYNCIHLSVASCFFRSESINYKQFEIGLISGEDTRFVNIMLLNKPKMGLLKEAIYFYRKRDDGDSIVQTAQKTDIFYFITPKKVHKFLLNLSILLFDKALEFIQYYVAYDLLFRIIAPCYKYLTLPKFIKYYQIMVELLKQIDDKILLEQKNVGNRIKIYALSKKHGKDMRNNIIFDGGKLKYENRIMIDPEKDENLIIWKILDIKDNILHLEGKDNCWMKREKYYYYCKVGTKIYFPKYINFDNYDLKVMSLSIIKGRIIIFDIYLNDEIGKDIKFYFSYMNNTREIFPTLGWFSRLPPIENSYYNFGNYIISYKRKRLNIYQNNEILKERLEIQYCEELWKLNKKNIISIRKKVIRKVKRLNNTEIWLINDRPNQAGDNGEHFFRYLKKKNPLGIIYYFVIRDNCSDYQRLKHLGNILSLGSKKYNFTFLYSNKIISSTSNSWVDNPFGDDRKYLVDLFRFDYIFLQHGITKDDVSHFLNKHAKNFKLILTAGKKEYKYFLNQNYGYTKENIKLTGFSRFDNLYKNNIKNKADKIILIIPTWRMNIKGTISTITYESIHSQNFNKTEFFKFYNNLMNSPELLETMEKYNYKGIFGLHPSFSLQAIDFHVSSLFTIKESFNYQEELLKASLLVTDYSSIFFDFAYIKKPVIYTQFDYEEYRKNHYKKGYFDYIKNGFGPVCYDLECSIHCIIQNIKNGCKIHNKYLSRIKSFFVFDDDSNSERIYQVINNISHNKNKFNIMNDATIFILIFVSVFILKYSLYLYHFYFIK